MLQTTSFTAPSPLTLTPLDFDLPGSLSEKALVSGLRRGDDTCYEHLVRQYGPRLLSVAKRFFRNELDAQDAVQDAFVTTFRSINKFDGRSKLETWLHRIVVNASLMRLRTTSRRRESGLEDSDGGSPELNQYDGLGNSSPFSAEERVLSDEQQRLVRTCVDQLPDRYRVVLVLRDLEELNTAQTAMRLGITPNAAKIRLHRARLALAVILREHRLYNGSADA